MINILRFVIGFIFLGLAAYIDYKTRKASNNLWILMGSFGVIFSIIEIRWGYILISLIIIIAMLALFYTTQMGGADVKAIICIAILTPILVIDSILWGCILMVISFLPLYLIKHKKYSLKQLGTEYRYPFLVPLWIGFILAFWIPIVKI